MVTDLGQQLAFDLFFASCQHKVGEYTLIGGPDHGQRVSTDLYDTYGIYMHQHEVYFLREFIMVGVHNHYWLIHEDLTNENVHGLIASGVVVPMGYRTYRVNPVQLTAI